MWQAMILFFIMGAAGWSVGFVIGNNGLTKKTMYKKGYKQGYERARRDIRSRQY